MSLTHLFLGGNNIKDIGLRFICEGLQNNFKFTHIDLRNNNISQISAIYISKLMKNHSNLAFLDLSFMHLGVMLLSKEIKINRSVTFLLSLKGNNLSEVSAKLLSYLWSGTNNFDFIFLIKHP